MATTLFFMVGSLGERDYRGKYLNFFIELQDNLGWMGLYGCYLLYFPLRGGRANIMFQKRCSFSSFVLQQATLSLKKFLKISFK